MRTDRLLLLVLPVLLGQGIPACCGSPVIHRCSTASFPPTNSSSKHTITVALSSHAWSRDARLVFPRPIWPPTKGKWFSAVCIRTRVNHLRARRRRKTRPPRDTKSITRQSTKNPSGAESLPMSGPASSSNSHQEEGNCYLGSMSTPSGNPGGDPPRLRRRPSTTGCPSNHLNWPGPNRSSCHPWSNCGVAERRRGYLCPSTPWPTPWLGACLATWIT